MISTNLFNPNEYEVHNDDGFIIGCVWPKGDLWLSRLGQLHLPPTTSRDAAVDQVLKGYVKKDAINSPQIKIF